MCALSPDRETQAELLSLKYFGLLLADEVDVICTPTCGDPRYNLLFNFVLSIQEYVALILSSGIILSCFLSFIFIFYFFLLFYYDLGLTTTVMVVNILLWLGFFSKSLAISVVVDSQRWCDFSFGAILLLHYFSS